jgi:perosamine synthetase
MRSIPVSEPLLNGNERRYVNECLDSGWISSEGPFSRKFEEQFAKRVGRKHGIAVCNGSAALEAAVSALGIGPGDEVILPSFTIISCAAAVIRSGATPVLVDSDPSTWNLDPSNLEALVSLRTKAIMVVHIYGLPVDMDPVLALAARHGLHIIEDAAEMHGQSYRGKPCGSFGSISTFSFYSNKNVTTGEGGMIVTDDDALAERCRGLRNLCFQPAKRFVHEELGWNMRMSNLNAALGLAQLERIDEFIARKRHIGAQYNMLLADIDGVQLPVPLTDYAENIYWAYGIVLDEGLPVGVEEIMTRLAERGVGTRPFFWPMHRQPVFCRIGMFAGMPSCRAPRPARVLSTQRPYPLRRANRACY